MGLDLIIQSFNTGELSPHLDGRSDLEKYYSGCRLLENMIPLPYGDAERRPGTYFVGELKNNSKKARLIPFQYSTEQAYILEYGDQYIRFYKDRGRIVTPTGTEDLSGISAVDTNIVGHWKLNEDAANQTVFDSDNNTHDGTTVTNNTNILHETGKVGSGCFNFGGVDAVQIDDDDALSFSDAGAPGTKPFSIAALAYVTDVSTRQVILSKWKGGTLREWRLSLDASQKLELALFDDSTSLDGNTVAHWKLNDNLADTVVVDAHGATHNGVASANTNTLHTTGKVGGCFDLNGAAYATVLNAAPLSFGNGTVDSPFSIAGWVYVEQTGSTQVILSKWEVTSREYRFAITDASYLRLQLCDQSTGKIIYVYTKEALSEGWHFVVATYTGQADAGATAANLITLYVDGEAIAAGDTSIHNEATYDAMEAGATKVVIGASYTTDPTLVTHWAGKIDNVALFKIELSAAEVTSLYNNGIGTEDLEGIYPYTVSDDALSVGWHLVAATYDSTGGTTAASGITLYVDGAVVDSTAHEQDATGSEYVAMENTITKVRIGAQIDSSDALEYVWADKLDNVALFKIELSAAQIASLYSTGACEISSPYLEADLFGIQKAQSADVLYNVHSSYSPAKLMRYAHDAWDLQTIVFDWPPFLEENDTDITITPAGAGAVPLAVGTSLSLTASSAIFTSGHIGSYWLIKHPRGAEDTANPNVIRKDFTAIEQTSDTLSDVKGTWHFRTSGAWTGRVVVERTYDGTNWHTIGDAFESVTASPQNFNVSGNEELGDAKYRMRSLTLPAWADACKANLSVERFYHYGIVKITGFTSATVVTGEVVRALQSEVATKLWSEGAWSDERGYPVTTEFYDGRQFYAGTSHRPLNIWGSKVQDYENIGIGTLDDDPVRNTVDSGMQNMIRWLVGQEVLLIGTSGGEWKLGSSDPAEGITPTSPIKPRLQTTYGSKKIQAILLASVVLFVDAKGRTVRGAQYIFEKGEAGGYDAPLYTLLAEHIAKSGIVDMAYQQNPYPILWCVRTDGVLIGMVFEPGQKVWGWFRCVIDGLVESVEVIRGTTEDEVWIIVKREINGSTKRYIEYFKPRDWGDDQADCFFVDSGLTFDGGAAVAITNITKASPGVVTAATHGFSDGDQVKISGVTGMNDIVTGRSGVNNKVFTVHSPATDYFSLRDKLDTVDWDTTGYKSYTFGGTVQKVENSFSGLDHLEGKTVSVLGDGSVHENVVVSSGSITLTDYFNKVHVGLPYESSLMPMKLEAQTRTGTARAKTKRIHSIIFSFYKTLGAEFGTSPSSGVPTETIPFRKTTDPMGSAPPLFTGEKVQTFNGGYELNGDIFVTQKQPLPMTVRSITPRLQLYG